MTEGRRKRYSGEEAMVAFLQIKTAMMKLLTVDII